MSNDETETTFARLKKGVLNHRWLALIVFSGAVVVALGAFSDALVKIGDLFRHDNLAATHPPPDGAKTAHSAGAFSIDSVTKVIDSTPNTLVFDVTVRNTTSSPIALTESRFDFDEHLRGVLASTQDVSGVYCVSIDATGAVVDGPTGKHTAFAWYPNPDGKMLIVECPLAQSIPPNSIDRFRLVFSGGGIVSPLEKVTVALTYDGSKEVRRENMPLR